MALTDCTAPTSGKAGYRFGCRCATCRAGQAARQRKYRAARSERAQIAAPPEVLKPAAPEQPAAAAAEAADLSDPLSLDPDLDPGSIEVAFAADLEGLVGDVPWKDTLAAMAAANARIVDQVGRHQRIDVLSGVQLRMLNILDRMRRVPSAGSQVPEHVPAEWSAAGLADPD